MEDDGRADIDSAKHDHPAFTAKSQASQDAPQAALDEANDNLDATDQRVLALVVATVVIALASSLACPYRLQHETILP